MRKSWTVVTVAALLVPIGAAPVSARPPSSPDQAAVLVMLREQVDLGVVTGRGRATRLSRTVAALHEQTRRSQAPILARLRTLSGRGRVTDTTPLWITNAVSVTATADVIAELAARPDVARIVPDAIDIVPAAAAPEPNQTSIHAPDLWGLGQTGAGVVVANLDSGVDASHPDLASRWRGGTNSWFDPYGQHASTPVDLTGHGTATMGVMVGGDAGGTSIGTAPGATWVAAKIFNDAGGATATAVHQAFQWVLDPDRDPTTDDAPQIVNGSWSIGAGPGCDLSFQPDVQALRSAGILPVFSAGNYGPGGATSVSPANYPESVSVGAVSGADLVQSSSSRGPSSCGGRTRVFPDVVAPGVDVYTADRYGLYQYASGTSVAAPHVAGALALLLGARPDLDVDADLQAVEGTARDLGTAGPDTVYGNGLVDAAAAYASLPPPAPPQPDFAVSLSPAAATVRAGDTTAFTVQVTPADGFTAEVALSRLGLDPEGVSTPLLRRCCRVAAPADGRHHLSDARGFVPVQRHGHRRHPDPNGRRGAHRHRTAATTAVLLDGGEHQPAGCGWDRGRRRHLRVERHWLQPGVRRAVAGVPGSANVDGYDRVSATSFYVSFADNVTIARPGPGTVGAGRGRRLLRRGHLVGVLRRHRAGLTGRTWISTRSVWPGSTVYFSTVGNTNPPGVGGAADDADSTAGTAPCYARVWDARPTGCRRRRTWTGSPGSTRPLLPLLRRGHDAAGYRDVQDEDVVDTDAGLVGLLRRHRPRPDLGQPRRGRPLSGLVTARLESAGWSRSASCTVTASSCSRQVLRVICPIWHARA